MPRFLPARIPHLTGELVELLPEGDRAGFWELSRLVEALFQHYSGGLARHVGQLYSPFDPDGETVPPTSAVGEAVGDLIGAVESLLERANYVRVPDDELLTAADRAVLGRLDLDVDVDSLQELAVFTRGPSSKELPTRSLRTLFRERLEEVSTFGRVVVLVRTREDPWLLLKLFKDVPTKDLELLLPTVRIKMKLLDKLKLSGSGTAAAISVWKLLRLLYSYLPTLTKLLAVPLKVLLLPLAAVLGLVYGGKTVLDYGKVKTGYVTALAEHLYAITMASNRSVLARLGVMAGEEETKELLVAYGLLLQAGGGLTAEQLAARAEAFAWDRYRARVAFDREDALRKLEELELVYREEDRIVAVPLDAALRKVDATWDELYDAPERAAYRRRQRLRG